MPNVRVRMLQAQEHDGQSYEAGKSVEVPDSVAWDWIHRSEPVAIAENGQAIVEPANLNAMLKDDLVNLAQERGVDTSGTKAELIERLES